MPVYWSFVTRMAVDSIRGRNVKLALVTGYEQSDTHTYWDDISTFEVAGSGYVSGGKPVVLDVYFDTELEAVLMTCAPVPFGLLGVSAANAAVFYDDTGHPATSRLLAVDEFADGPVDIAGQEFTYITAGISLTLAETVVEP